MHMATGRCRRRRPLVPLGGEPIDVDVCDGEGDIEVFSYRGAWSWQSEGWRGWLEKECYMGVPVAVVVDETTYVLQRASLLE